MPGGIEYPINPGPEALPTGQLIRFTLKLNDQFERIYARLHLDDRNIEELITAISGVSTHPFQEVVAEFLQTDPGVQQEPSQTLDEFLAIYDLNKRPETLSAPSKQMNELINSACRNIADEDIIRVASFMYRRRWGIRKESEESITGRTLESIFMRVYCTVATKISKDEDMTENLNSVINADLTFAADFKGTLQENQNLVPRIVTGVISKIMEEQTLTFGEALQSIIDLGPEEFNRVVYALRIGKNAAIAMSAISKQIDADYSETAGLNLSLNPVSARYKIQSLIDANKHNGEYMKALVELQGKIRAAGVKIDLITRERFGLAHGRSGGCPVTYADKSGGMAYFPQVELAFRVLEAIKQHRESKQRRSGLLGGLRQLLNISLKS
jgi:hypothetical protein